MSNSTVLKLKLLVLVIGALYFSGAKDQLFSIELPSLNSAIVAFNDIVDGEDAHHLAWCDRSYHQNVGCPLHGLVEVPAEVLAEQEAQHLSWCDSNYHQNVGCPLNGQVEIPAEVLAEQEAQFLAWCKEQNFGNTSCREPYEGKSRS